MISVLLATHNGADTIEHTLRAMSCLVAPLGGWELIVVNNASNDETEPLVLKWRERLPLRYLVERRLGKSKAINTALAAAKGEFIVMTDDDVLPDRNWLAEWRRIADEFPDIAVFSGAVVPEFVDSKPPAFVSDGSYGALYGAHVPEIEGEIKPSNSSELIEVSGANLAMRKSAYERGNRLDEIYLIGNSGLMGEDTDFVNRMAKAGYKVGYTPEPLVRHIVHGHQTRLSWIFRRYCSNGRARFMLTNVRWDMAAKRYRFPFPWGHAAGLFGSGVRLLGALVLGNRHEAFRQLTGIASSFGALQQALSLCCGGIGESR